MGSRPDLLVAQVHESLSDEQLEQILDLGLANYVDAYRVDIADAPQEQLEKAKSAWDLELSNHLGALQHHVQAGTEIPPLTLILAQVARTGRVAGFLLAEQLLESRKACEIRFVVVHKEYRQRGLLGKMISALACSYSMIKLDCKDESYFLSAGFVVTGELGMHKLMQFGALSDGKPRSQTSPELFAG